MEPDRVIITWKKMEAGTREALMVSGALLLVIALAFIWAAFLRKRRHSHQHHHSHNHSHGSTLEPAEMSEGAGSPKGRKKRRRRREHRPTNPTLAQTGGLPPIRGGSPPGSSH